STATSIAYTASKKDSNDVEIPASFTVSPSNVGTFDSYIQSLGVFKDTDFTINFTNGTPKIDNAQIDIDGGKRLTFNNATITNINAESPADDPGVTITDTPKN